LLFSAALEYITWFRLILFVISYGQYYRILWPALSSFDASLVYFTLITLNQSLLCLLFLDLESKQPVDEVKNYGRLGPENVMFNYSGCAGIIIVEADRLGVCNIY